MLSLCGAAGLLLAACSLETEPIVPLFERFDDSAESDSGPSSGPADAESPSGSADAALPHVEGGMLPPGAQPEPDGGGEAGIDPRDADLADGHAGDDASPDDGGSGDASPEDGGSGDAGVDGGDAGVDGGDAGVDGGEDASKDAGPECDPPPACHCPHQDAEADEQGCVPEPCQPEECTPDQQCSFVSASYGEYYFCDTQRTWRAAEGRCQNAGLRLVVIEDEEEDEYLLSQISDKTWVGASDLEEEGQWRWSDGSLFFEGTADDGEAVEDAYENWYDDEPNNLGLTDGLPDCMILWSENGAWADAACSDLHGYICEVE